jgi:hypothetical protein
MRNMENFNKILNSQRSFFIKKFDGKLKRVKFIVKIFPCLSKSISAISLIRLLGHEAGSSSLMLVDKDLYVDCYEESLSNLFRYTSLQEVKHIKQISERLYLDLLQFLGYYRDQWIKSNKNIGSVKEITKVLEREKTMINPVDYANAPKLDIVDVLNLGTQGRGKTYRIHPDSILYKAYGGYNVSVSVETELFVNTQLVFKLYMNMHDVIDSDSDIESRDAQSRYQRRALAGLKGIKNIKQKHEDKKARGKNMIKDLGNFLTGVVDGSPWGVLGLGKSGGLDEGERGNGGDGMKIGQGYPMELFSKELEFQEGDQYCDSSMEGNRSGSLAEEDSIYSDDEDLAKARAFSLDLEDDAKHENLKNTISCFKTMINASL